jgi:hypothetical protein
VRLAIRVAWLALLSACAPSQKAILSRPASAKVLINNIEDSIQSDLISKPDFYQQENLLTVFGSTDVSTQVFGDPKTRAVIYFITGLPPGLGITSIPQLGGKRQIVLSFDESGGTITNAHIQIYFGASDQAPTFEDLAASLGAGWEHDTEKENRQYMAAGSEPFNESVERPLILSYGMARSGRGIDLNFEKNHHLWSLIY